MNKLRFNQKPTLRDLNNIENAGSKFEEREGFVTEDSIILPIQDTSGFRAMLEVFRNIDGTYDLIMTQLSVGGPDYWEMSDALKRIKLCNQGIEEELRKICNELIKKGLATWID